MQSRQRGVPFDEFWKLALRPGEALLTTETVRTIEPVPIYGIVWPKDSGDRANAQAAIRGTEEGWRRAYEGVPPSKGEIALLMLNALAVEAAGGLAIGDAVPLAA